MPRPVYIVDGARSPFLKAKTERGPFSASDLAVSVGRTLLTRQNFSATDIDEVIMGCMMPSEDEANIARLIALRLGCGNDVPAWTVQRNCASGLQALDCAVQDIQVGRANLVLAGGTEVMSRAPLLFRPKMVNWFGRLNAAKSFGAKAAVMTQFRLSFLAPIIALLHGLSDPLCGMNMGQTAELLAYQFDITRADMDAYAASSQLRTATAIENNYFANEIATLYDNTGRFYKTDEGVRRDSTAEKLAKLKPVFDRPYGLVTAGNSSQVTDGAALLLLASEEAVEKFNLPVLAKVIDTQWSALAPEVMGLGPAFASAALLKKQDLNLSDIDYWEFNEAFAAQVIACTKALASETFCREQLGLPGALGTIDPAKLNIDGGAIALGHPVGASGARVVLHLINTLRREKAKRGIASLCIGGGQGGAMLIETV
ncbi:MAG: acetyl-CoA C-acetyltransferase [Coxiellaceae bacterium]|nr:acetyl-CoA C-acetyltransferase [Coxiellaceae bacterium]